MDRPPLVALCGATIVDGTGAPALEGDILVEDGRIRALGDVAVPADAEPVDVHGQVVAPGFIDLHSHSDLALLSEPTLGIKVRQGITTELIGQDGISYAPASTQGLAASRELFAPVNGDGEGLDWSWRSVGEFLARFGATGPNVACLVPQGTVRLSVIGFDRRPATSSELDRMRELVAEGMRDGAFGLSTGLTYPPGAWTSTDELVELARVTAALGGIYVTHHRDYGVGLAGAIEEALEIGRRAGIPVHFSHFHVSGPRREEHAAEFLGPLEAARAAGQRVTLDVYPYTAGCTTLTAFLPDWLRSRPVPEIVATLGRAEERARVIADLSLQGPGKTSAGGWEDFVVGGAEGEQPHLRGRRLGDLARTRGISVEALVCDLIAATRGRVCVLVFQGHEANVFRVLRDPEAAIGTDGILACGVPHPRAAGTFPRILRHARDGKLALETAVAMMTGRAAAILGLSDRGTVRVGQAADLVVFDRDRVADTADYANPTAAPEGISHVLVNGEFVVRDAALTGALPGRVLRKGQSSPSIPRDSVLPVGGRCAAR